MTTDAPVPADPTAARMPRTAPVYAALGVRRVINAADTYTALGGGRLPEEVLAAMTAAAAHHVDVEEVLAAVGGRLAELLEVPAALVVNGAAGGLAVAAAACMAGAAPGRVGTLPEAPGERCELVVLRCQRNPYDRAFHAAGARLVEVGYADTTPVWAVESALTSRTAAVVYYAGDQFERWAPTLSEVAEAAHAAAVPVIVDAAAQLPPVSNLRRYLDEGGDLVLFSGGKGLRGPQSSGLVVGREDLVRACAANSYPHHSVGRAMKGSKENVLGLLAAVERALRIDWDAEYARWESLLEGFAERLAAVRNVRTWSVPTGRLGQACPRLFIEWGRGRTAGEVAAALAAADPSIRIGVDQPRSRTIFLNPYSLLPDEEDHLIEAVVRELKEPRA